EAVAGPLQLLEPRGLDEHGHHARTEIRRRVETRAHRCAADRKFTEAGERRAETLDPGLDLAGVTTELLAQGHRDRIHQVRATRLDDRAPLLRLLVEGTVQVLESGDQILDRRLGRG